MSGDPLSPLHDAQARRTLRSRLLSWFDRSARDLPWRRTRDPYAIWISEVMLQQTQVATVIPYFQRFLDAFPDVRALAAAEEQDVLRLWEGLGYYRRARDLHAAARRLAAQHDGRIPDDAEALRRLPGLGRYTVNAVLSQAYGRPLPIVEANSRRVLCRLLGVRGDPTRSAVQASLWEAAEALLPRRRAGAFNQALMELGALVCTPQTPACEACPVARHCVARRRGWQTRIPTAGRRAVVEQVDEIAVALRRRDRVLLVQRPEGGRWAGMWEFPRGPVQGSRAQAARQLLDALGLKAELGREIATVRHIVTRFRITLACFEAAHRGGRFRRGDYTAALWAPLARLVQYPSSRPQRRLAEAVFAHGG